MNRAFLGAMKKGYQANERGVPIAGNPYGDDRTHRGSVTFSRAFWKAWNRGWQTAQADRARGDNDGWCEERVI